jgi:hypothetical protein
MQVKLGPISLETPDDYMPRMFVMTAPEAEKPKMGMMVTKQAQTFARNITVGTEAVDEGTTSDGYAEAQLAAMKAGMMGFQLLKKSTVNIAGKDCPLYEIQSAGPEGRLLQALTAYFVHGKTAFTLTASQMAGLPFNEVKKEYLAIFASAKSG